MKILIIHYRYFISGGPERYLFNLKDALEKRSHIVIPFSIRNSRNISSPYNSYFVDNIGKSNEVFINKYPKTLRTYIDLISREFYSMKVKRQLKKLIKDTKPDICYLLVYKRALSYSVIDACYEMGIPIVNRISDYNPVCGSGALYQKGVFCKDCFINNDKSILKKNCIKDSKLFSFIRYISIKFSQCLHIDTKIDEYVCTNGFMKEMMCERGFRADKLNIIPTFFREKEEYKQLDKGINLPIEKLRLLYIGNIDESKGIYDLIDALDILKKKSLSFHLSIVGGLHKDENDKVLNLLDSKGLKSYITFESFRTDGKIFEFYLNNHITVLPARWPENLPNTLIESIYFHRPVVVPKWGSFKFTTNDKIAFYYDAHNPISLAETLLNIINNPQLINDKSTACEAFFKENYTEEVHINNLLQLFKRTIKS